MFLDRFPLPDEEEPVSECSQCATELYAGEEVIKCEDNYFCSEHCFATWFIDGGEVERGKLNASNSL